MTTRVRHRRISEQRIAKIAAEMQARGVAWAMKLGTDGSVTLTESTGAALTHHPEDDAAREWAKLGIQ